MKGSLVAPVVRLLMWTEEELSLTDDLGEQIQKMKIEALEGSFEAISCLTKYFNHFEIEGIRAEILKITSIGIWHHLLPPKLDKEMQNADLRRAFEKSHKEDFIKKLIDLVISSDDSLFVDGCVKFFLLLLSQLPTRRYLATLLIDHQLDVSIANIFPDHSLALRHYLYMPIDQVTLEHLDYRTSYDLFCEKVHTFKRHLPTSCKLRSYPEVLFVEQHLTQFTFSDEEKQIFRKLLDIRPSSDETLVPCMLASLNARYTEDCPIVVPNNLFYLNQAEYQRRWHQILKTEFDAHCKVIVEEARKKLAVKDGWSPVAMPVLYSKPNTLVISLEDYDGEVTELWDELEEGEPLLLCTEEDCHVSRLKSIKAILKPLSDEEILAALRQHDPNLIDLKNDDSKQALELRKKLTEQASTEARMVHRELEMTENVSKEVKFVCKLSLAANNPYWNQHVRTLLELQLMDLNFLPWLAPAFLGNNDPEASSPVRMLPTCTVDLSGCFSSAEQVERITGLKPETSIDVSLELRSIDGSFKAKTLNSSCSEKHRFVLSDQQITLLTNCLLPRGLTLIDGDIDHAVLKAFICKTKKLLVLSSTHTALPSNFGLTPLQVFQFGPGCIMQVLQYRRDLLDQVQKLAQQHNLLDIDYGVSCQSAQFLFTKIRLDDESPLKKDIDALRILELLGTDSSRVAYLANLADVLLVTAQDYIKHHHKLKARENVLVLEAENIPEPLITHAVKNSKRVILWGNTQFPSFKAITNLNFNQSLLHRLIRIGFPVTENTNSPKDPTIEFVNVKGTCVCLTPDFYQNEAEVNEINCRSLEDFVLTSLSFGQLELLQGEQVITIEELRSHPAKRVAISLCFTNPKERNLLDPKLWKMILSNRERVILFGDEQQWRPFIPNQ